MPDKPSDKKDDGWMLSDRGEADLLRFYHEHPEAMNKFVDQEDVFCSVGEAVDNVFCATGEGGGVDPSCTPGVKKHKLRNYEVEVSIALSQLTSGEPEVAAKIKAGETPDGWNAADMKAINKYRKAYKEAKEGGWDSLPEASYWKGKLVAGDGSHRIIAAILEGADSIKFAFDKRTGPVPTENVFCATGEGGGVDPTCGKQTPHQAAGTKTFEEHFPLSVQEKLNRFFSSNDKVNHFARTGEHLPRAQKRKIEETVEEMNKQFKENALFTTKELTLWRGSQGFGEDLEAGEEFTDGGFPSTSLTRFTAEVYSGVSAGGRGHIFQITTPKGTKYLPGQTHQAELILPPKTKFRVVSTEKLPTGGKLLNIEVVSDTTTEDVR